MTHLSSLELSLAVDRLIDPSLPEYPDARAAAHLRECELCRTRLNSLHAQDREIAKALWDDADDDSETAPEYDIDRMAADMMNRLRNDVAKSRRSANGEASGPDTVHRPAEDTKRRPERELRIAPHGTRYPRRLGATIAAVSFAAGIGFAILVPALRGPAASPGGTTFGLAPAVEQSIRDSVPGFEDKVYLQKVSADAGVSLTVDAIDGIDLDCALYNSKESKPIAVDNEGPNSCSFSIPARDAGEYRLVVKNRVGAPISYRMVRQAVHQVPHAGGKAAEPVAP